MEKTANFFVCDLLVVLVGVIACVSSSLGLGRVCLGKFPDRRRLRRLRAAALSRSTSDFILTILWFREKGGIGFAICINFFCNNLLTLDVRRLRRRRR